MSVHGSPDDLSAAAGGPGTISAKLRTLTEELAALGASGDAAVTAGAVGSIAAKLRLVTTQLAGGMTVAQTAGPWAVSGTVAVGSPHDVSQTAGPWAVSGTVTVNPQNVGQTAGPWAVSGSVSAVITGGSIKTDKTGFTEGSSTFTPVGGVVNDTASGDVTEDANGAFRMTSKRALHVSLRNGVGNELGTAAAPLAIQAASGLLTDRSGKITAGGAAQPLAASNPTRRYLLIQNTSSGSIWFNFTATAVSGQPSIQLAAGSAPFLMDGSFVTPEAVSVIGLVTDLPYTAKEG